MTSPKVRVMQIVLLLLMFSATARGEDISAATNNLSCGVEATEDAAIDGSSDVTSSMQLLDRRAATKLSKLESDIPRDQIRTPATGYLPPTEKPTNLNPFEVKVVADELILAAPDYWDWRDVNGTSYVTPVYDQGNLCGNCYAMATTSQIESYLLRTNHSLSDFDFHASISYPAHEIQYTTFCMEAPGVMQGCAGGHMRPIGVAVAEGGKRGIALMNHTCVGHDAEKQIENQCFLPPNTRFGYPYSFPTDGTCTPSSCEPIFLELANQSQSCAAVESDPPSLYSKQVVDTPENQAWDRYDYFLIICELIKTHGPVTMPINSDEIKKWFLDGTCDKDCCRQRTMVSNEGAADHAVLIVGYDKNRHVLEAPAGSEERERPGAFLVKNSWGKGFCDNGYFWLSWWQAAALEPESCLGDCFALA